VWGSYRVGKTSCHCIGTWFCVKLFGFFVFLKIKNKKTIIENMEKI
jgi:hypothetical protein